MNRSGRGRFITFEGGEGAGKSTQLRQLAAALRARGIDVVITREPGGSPRAEEIRTYLLAGHARDLGATAEAVLFSAARLDHIDRLIRPALERGAWVLCDRFADSTRAYQGALGDVDTGLIDALERVVVGDMRPDLTIVLDIAAPVGLARAAARRGADAAPDRFEAEDVGFHTRLRSAFQAIAEQHADRCVVVDADQEETAVAAAIAAIVEQRFEELVHPHEPVIGLRRNG
ncbi:dTMP kinase [Chelatococcus reniformis]|uniref:Thymidylate kinase n=1 Tax=Chelatococcus reniformis TaxID=1494448 RepID=A0A916U188_9HYPH|nr:dTMP kinase [Chelatococcus reniformis]GGC56624.1 thymidylate kinase [Chelatococcus reniformis]